jgi:hypothetical protein
MAANDLAIGIVDGVHISCLLVKRHDGGDVPFFAIEIIRQNKC